MLSSLSRLSYAGLAVSTIFLASQSGLRAQNDECTGAIAVVDGANGPFSSAGATTSFVWPCTSGGNDVWFSYVASCCGTLTVDTCAAGRTFDTTLQVFSGDCANLVSLGCNDDSCGLGSRVSASVVVGRTYYIRMGGYNGATGSATLTLACAASAPANDECSGATTVSAGANGPFDSTCASTSFSWPCAAGGNDLWYVHVAACTGSLTVDTCGAGYDTALEVFSGNCANLVSLGCNDDSCGLQSSLTVPVTIGSTYYIRVGGFLGARGTFPLNISCSGVGLPNDECAGALPVVDGANGPFSTAAATTSSPSWPCALGGSDLWYVYVATCCGNLNVTTCDPTRTYDTAIQIFDGQNGCGGLVSLGCNDDAGGTCGLGSSLTVPVVQGWTYYIRLGGYFALTGTASLTLTCTPGLPANDECTGAVTVNMGDNGPFNNLCATTSAPAWPCAAGGNDVWFAFTATCTAPHTFRTCGANYDTALQVFSGDCANLVSLGCNDDAGPNGGPCAFTLQSALTVNLTINTTYYIRVGGFAGNRGIFPLRITTGTGTGSITTVSPGCGPMTIAVTGEPSIGYGVTTTLTGGAGLTFIGYGFNIVPTPFCVCVVGHDWASANFATTNTLNVPCNTIFIGNSIGVQGADFLAPGGCPAPQLVFTDTVRITIG